MAKEKYFQNVKIILKLRILYLQKPSLKYKHVIKIFLCIKGFATNIFLETLLEKIFQQKKKSSRR